MENLPKKCHSGLGNYDGCWKTSGPWITIRWIQFDWTWQQSLILFSKGGMWIWYPQNVTMKWEVSNSWWHDPFLMRTARCISFGVSRQILYHRYGCLFVMMLSNSCLPSYLMLFVYDVYICIDYSHTHINKPCPPKTSMLTPDSSETGASQDFLRCNQPCRLNCDKLVTRRKVKYQRTLQLMAMNSTLT